MIFDSHCHPQFPQYDNDREEMITRAFGAGVGMICVGTDLEMSKKGIGLAEKYENIWATVGVHPNDVTKAAFAKAAFVDLLKRSKVVAIGEVGLDYYRTPEPEKQKKQKEVFEQFIDLAIKHDKPLVLHFRDSPKGSFGRVHKDAIQILDSRFEILDSKVGCVSHSFTGNLEEAKEYINRGMYLGFNGIITFRSPSVALREGGTGMYDEVVRYTPLEQILLETDAPYLTPEPYRGRRNEPVFVVEVAKKIAELRKESLEKVLEQTTQNCQKLFKLV